MDNEQPRQELVKCVLVGDTAVGKTRLICARACNKHVSLSQLLATHVPTVWAIDQYRIYKDVLERSWEVIDGVNVSLRLWDTFGDHDKDRRFAYGRADIVLLCYSITNPMSLRNCRTMWIEEIRRFCPQTPVILVGCKNDLRYMYRDETYLSNLGDRSPFIRVVRKSDLVMPDEARAVAKELGVSYYETSVFNYFGVNEVFENAIRAALIARRQQRFWMTNLKRVQRPLLQAPFRPPKPAAPEVSVFNGTYIKDMQNMLQVQRYTDVILIVGTFQFIAHKFMLVAGSTAFYRLLTMEFSDMGARSSSESSIVSSTYGDSLPPEGIEDTDCLLKSSSNCNNDQSRPQLRIWDQFKRRSYQTLPTQDPGKVTTTTTTTHAKGGAGIRKPPIDIYRELNHPIFQSIKVVHNPLMQSTAGGYKNVRFTIGERSSHAFVRHPLLSAPSQTIITLNSKVVSPEAMEQCLKFIYCGSVDKDYCIDIQEIRQAAEFLELPKLIYLLSNLTSENSGLSEETSLHYSACVRKNLERYCIKAGMFGDITFELDDGQMKAHRAILIERSEVMRAMLNGDFREAHANIIVFPGVTEYTFHKLLCFIYTDEIPPIAAEKCLNLLELANRLCLPRLLNLVECRVVENLTKLSQNETPADAVEQCLKLLEPVKLHNAHQLAEFCMSYLCVNFNAISKVSSSKCFRGLHPENQEYLKEHRWPPVWYLKDFDYYQRSLNEYHKEQKDAKQRAQEESCFCFNGLFSWLTGRNQKPTAQQTICAANGELTRNGNSDGGGGVGVRMFSSHGNSLNRIVIEPDADLNF